MPEIKSLEELRQLREEMIQAVRARRQTSTVITVGMGTCGIAAGRGKRCKPSKKNWPSGRSTRWS